MVNKFLEPLVYGDVIHVKNDEGDESTIAVTHHVVREFNEFPEKRFVVHLYGRPAVITKVVRDGQTIYELKEN